MREKEEKNALAQMANSRQMTLVLVALVIGINMAHVLRNGSWLQVLLAALVLAIAGGTAVIGSMAESRKETSGAPRRGLAAENAVLALLLITCLWGIFG